MVKKAPPTAVKPKVREVKKDEATVVKLDSSTPSVGAIVRIVLVVLIVISLANLAQTLFVAVEGLIILVILATFFAYLLAPLVDLMQKPFTVRGHRSEMPRWVAIAIVYLGVFTVLWFTGAYLVPRLSDQINEFGTQVPAYTQQLRVRAEELNERYKNSAIPPQFKQEIETNVSHLFGTVGEYATAGISTVLLGSITYLPWVILIPIFGFFLLKDGEGFKDSIILLFPEGDWQERIEAFLEDINISIAAYTRAQLISCLLIGTVCTTGFYLIGLRYALLLGILAGILEFISLVGPLTVLVIAVTIAGFTSFNEAIQVGVFLVVLRLIHDYVTYPRIVRQGIHLHPLAVILSVLAGGEIGGIIGIFLAIPFVAVATVIYKHLIKSHHSSAVVEEILNIETVQTNEKTTETKTTNTEKTETFSIQQSSNPRFQDSKIPAIQDSGKPDSINPDSKIP